MESKGSTKIMDIVSVILPTYNRANYIKDAIESVLNQSYKNIELIIIDDGSTDNTEEVISPFLKDNRIKCIKQENSGAAAARNRGLALKTGKYVAFIDSDDIWEKDKLEIQLAVMDALPDVAIVCSDFSSIDAKGYVEKSHIKTYFSVFNDYKLSYEEVFCNMLTQGIKWLQDTEKVYWGNVYNTMIFGNLILTSTTLFRKEAFDKVGFFDITYETLEDYDLFLRLAQKYSVAFVDKPLIRYRYNENQLSGKAFFGRLCSNLITIFQKNIASIKDEEFLNKNKIKIKRHLGMIQSWQAYFYFSNGDMPLAARHYWQSICNNPFIFNSYIYFLTSLLPKSMIHLIKKLKSKKQRFLLFLCRTGSGGAASTGCKSRHE